MAYVLIVDDSKTACVILARKLKQLGIDSDSVYSAQEAFDYLKTSHPDVIFLDHNMPEMSGLEAIKVIKNNPRTSSIPVMMYTSQHGQYYVGQARALGAVEVLPKELGTAHIERALTKLGLMNADGEGTTEEEVISKSHSLGGDEAQVVNEEEQSISQLASQASSANTTNAAKSGDIREIIGQLTPKLRHQLYLTTVEVQQAFEDQLGSSVKQMKKQIVNEVIPIAEALDKQAEEFQAYRKKSMRMHVVSLIAIGLLGLLVLFMGMQGQTASVELYKNSADSSIASKEIDSSDPANADDNKPTGSAVNSSSDKGSDVNLIASTQKVQTLSSLPKKAKSEAESLKVLDDQGAVIGSVVQWSYERNSFFLMNKKDYLFELGANGELIASIPERFFTSADCYGDSYVSAFPGQVFRDTEEGIWYTPKNSLQESIQPLSKLTSEGNCERLSGSEMTLSTLLANELDETGVNSIKYELGQGFMR